MKATGVVRRIDDLGRIVIPKEIRRTMRIKEGDPLEIFLTNDKVCFGKYQLVDVFSDDVIRICKRLRKILDFDFAVCNTEQIVYQPRNNLFNMDDIKFETSYSREARDFVKVNVDNDMLVIVDGGDEVGGIIFPSSNENYMQMKMLKAAIEGFVG